MITMIAPNTTAVRPLAELTLMMKPKPYLALVASTTAQYVQPMPYTQMVADPGSADAYLNRRTDVFFKIIEE